MATQRLLPALQNGLLSLVQGSAAPDQTVIPVQASAPVQAPSPSQPVNTGFIGGAPYGGQEQPAQGGQIPWYEMKSGGGKLVGEQDTPWYKDPNVYNSLALGFNSMRLNPDQGLAQVIGQRMKTAQEVAAGNRTATAVSNALRAKGLTAEADLVMQTPSLAGEFSKLLSKGSTNTDAIQTREQSAKLLGYEPGSPEYKAIIAGGKPSDVGQQDWDRSKSIRGEFVAIPAVRSFSEQSQAFGRVVASANNPSPAGDIALIFNFMKILDPGSTVREGEAASIQQAGSIPNRIISLYNQVVEGTKLSDPQRADFVGRAQKLYGNAEQSYAKTEAFYRGLAQRAGLSPTEVIPDYRYGGEKPQPMLARPPEVPQATWDAMTREQKQQFLNAG